MGSLLTLDGAKKSSPAVTAWLETKHGELGALARHWFAKFRACGSDVLELLHDGCPVACVRNAPFGYVNAFKAHVNVGFFQGASLLDPDRLLIGDGKYMRHVKLKPAEVIDAAALERLIVVAYQDIHMRLRHHSGSP